MATPSSKAGLRVLLVDDHAVVRQGLRMFLAADNGLQVVGEARNGQEAIAILMAALSNTVFKTTLPFGAGQLGVCAALGLIPGGVLALLLLT